MDYFTYKNGSLYCEDVLVSRIISRVGSPVYIYSAETLLMHYRAIASAFAKLRPTVCFSVKGLSNIHVLSLLHDAGSGFDVVSGGELYRVSVAGGDMKKTVFAGVGKTDKEISDAISAGIFLFNVESKAEFENLSRLASNAGKQVRAALRVNPDVFDPKTHAYTATGKKQSKFGVDINHAEEFFAQFSRDPNVTLDGIHIHIGSPIYSAQPYVQAISKILELKKRLADKQIEIRLLDIGGGFAADYETGKSPTAEDYADAIIPLLDDAGMEIVLEPGRQISANSGILATKIQYVKEGFDRRFWIVDAAMTDLMRPALYGAEHFIYPVQLRDDEPVPQRRIDYSPPSGGSKTDVVGGVCESADFLAKDRMLPQAKAGDALAVFSAGAYCSVMSSRYNSRPIIAEVLVSGSEWKIIRRRETYDDLISAERDLPEQI